MMKRLLLGPQRPVKNLGEAMAKAEFPPGPVAVISAGWQEAEGDIDDVRELVQRPLTDLRLYHRAEEILEAEPTLRDALRQRQDQLKELQRLYRQRLRQLKIAARQTMRADGDPDLVAAEVRHAISQVRALDKHHLNRVAAIHKKFDAAFDNAASAVYSGHHAEILEILEECETILVTGGNVVVLLNRLRMFDLQSQLTKKHLVAWSAGAMILSDIIVLYHDRTPQGRRDPEVLGAGTCVLPGYVFLPDAKRRLREGDGVRVGLLHRRFAPAMCVTLDSGSAMVFGGTKLQHNELAKRMTRDGKLARIRTR
jgi:hypothetical protein